MGAGICVERSGGDGPFPIRVARGARAVEAELMAEIAVLVDESVRDPRLLRHPVRVVVPSRSLRAHLAAAVMRHFGRAVAGVSVQTLHAVALEIVENRRGVMPQGEALYPILVYRHAREEPAFRERLDGILVAYSEIIEAVAERDGLTPRPGSAETLRASTAIGQPEAPGSASRKQL